MLISEGELTWPTLPADPPDGSDPELWQQAQKYAVDHLWSYTARQFGTRVAMYRPAALDESGSYVGDLAYLTATWGWAWLPIDTTVTDDGGGQLRAVLVLPGPARDVTEVVVAGVTVPASAYRLDGSYLVRVDGQTWPTTQNLLADDGDANTWHVEYTRGVEVPVAGQIAAGQLALEWLKNLQGDKNCLPWNVTNVSRGGVTIAKDVTKLAKWTNVEAADRWVERVNPDSHTRPPSIWSPDLPRGGTPYQSSDR